ncbi:MAG: DUF1501 domain-containing protein [Fuerstiella sp.]|nr:DUF1501 domain-containing protein [Fuerstiella sp.]
MAFHRRELLQVGASSFFGVGLSGLLNLQARATAASQRTPKVKSVVLVFLTGGGSHIDMFDPKPDSAETKGEFSPIATRTPGLHFGELMIGMAARSEQMAVVRSMSHGDNRHLSGTHNILTGVEQIFRGDSNQDKSLNRGDNPCYGGALNYLQPSPDGLPSQVTIPNPLNEGSLIWPAQHAGFLGPKYDPFQVTGDPNSDKFRVNDLSLVDGISAGRFEGRWQLLNQVAQQRRAIEDSSAGQKLNDYQNAAYSMLSSGRLTKAFDLDRETPETRQRYGRNSRGQTLLLARRLVEAEIPFIQCNMGIVQSWDTHVNHFPRCKSELLPTTDRGVSALMDDLTDQGRLDETLIIVVGEFGRTPKISPLAGQTVPGRHHWAHGYTAVFAGGGVRGGQVIGKTDNIGGYPVTTPWHPNDIGATVYNSLGIDPESTIHDRTGRPNRLNHGRVMDVLYS